MWYAHNMSVFYGFHQVLLSCFDTYLQLVKYLICYKIYAVKMGKLVQILKTFKGK